MFESLSHLFHVDNGGALRWRDCLAKEENSSTGNVIPAVAPHIHMLTRHKRIHAQKSGDLLDEAPISFSVDRVQIYDVQN
jgi:hypothetical protein